MTDSRRYRLARTSPIWGSWLLGVCWLLPLVSEPVTALTEMSVLDEARGS